MNTTQQTSNSLSPNVTEGVSASFVSSLYGGSDRAPRAPVPGAVVRRTGLGHFGDPHAHKVERLTWLTGAAG